MATLRARCTQCGRPVLVPMEAYTIPIMCYGCQGLQHSYYGYVNNNAPPLVNYHSGYGYGYAQHNRPRNQFYYPRQAQPLQLMAPPPTPPLTPSSAYGNKRALLIGITYGDHTNSLKGSVNDAQSMKYLLIHKLGFPSDSIRMLTGILLLF